MISPAVVIARLKFLHRSSSVQRDLRVVPDQDSNPWQTYSSPAHCTNSLSYAAPWLSTPHPDWSMPHPTELRLTLSELRRSLLSCAAPCCNAAPYWVTPHYYCELSHTLLSYAAPLLIYTAHYWVTQYSVRYRYLVFLLLCGVTVCPIYAPACNPLSPPQKEGVSALFLPGGGGWRFPLCMMNKPLLKYWSNELHIGL